MKVEKKVSFSLTGLCIVLSICLCATIYLSLHPDSAALKALNALKIPEARKLLKITIQKRAVHSNHFGKVEAVYPDSIIVEYLETKNNLISYSRHIPLVVTYQDRTETSADETREPIDGEAEPIDLTSTYEPENPDLNRVTVKLKRRAVHQDIQIGQWILLSFVWPEERLAGYVVPATSLIWINGQPHLEILETQGPQIGGRSLASDASEKAESLNGKTHRVKVELIKRIKSSVQILSSDVTVDTVFVSNPLPNPAPNQ